MSVLNPSTCLLIGFQFCVSLITFCLFCLSFFDSVSLSHILPFISLLSLFSTFFPIFCYPLPFCSCLYLCFLLFLVSSFIFFCLIFFPPFCLSVLLVLLPFILSSLLFSSNSYFCQYRSPKSSLLCHFRIAFVLTYPPRNPIRAFQGIQGLPRDPQLSL